MRRLIALFLVLSALLGLVGCDLIPDLQTGHVHQYTDTMISPSDTERGYTLHTCECGDSYADAYFSASSGLEYELLTSGKYSVIGIGNCTDVSIVIPRSYKGIPVEVIGERAFEGCQGFWEILIPDSVTTIEARAFSSSSFKHVNIPDSVTSIGDYVFYLCERLGEIEIPDSVTHLGQNAFYSSGISNIVLGNGITEIKKGTFNSCDNLKSITIPGSVTSIGEEAFYQCRGLESVTLNNGLITISDSAFYGCFSLESIHIPDTVTMIGNRAFHSCHALESVIIGNSVTVIGTEAFTACAKLKSINIPKSVTLIKSDAFWLCPKLESAVFEETTGWREGDIEISPEILEDPATAAKYLKTYTQPWSRK